MPRFVLESIVEHFHHYLPIADPSGEQGARPWQSPVACRPALLAPGYGTRLFEECFGRAQSEVSIIDDFGGALTRSFGQASFGVGLQSPGDAPEQELLFESWPNSSR